MTLLLTWLRPAVSEEHAPGKLHFRTKLRILLFVCKMDQKKITLLGWNKAQTLAWACSQSNIKQLSEINSHTCGISHRTPRISSCTCQTVAPSRSVLLWITWQHRLDPGKARAHDCILRNQSRQQAFCLGFTCLSQLQKGRKYAMTNTWTPFAQSWTSGASLPWTDTCLKSS